MRDLEGVKERSRGGALHAWQVWVPHIILKRKHLLFRRNRRWTYLNCSHSSCRVILNNHHLDIQRTILIADTYSPTSFGTPSGCVSALLPRGWGSTAPHISVKATCSFGFSVWFLWKIYFEYVQFCLQIYKSEGSNNHRHGKFKHQLLSLNINRPEHKNEVFCKGLL